jgi:diaminopimelate epimerase
VRFGKLHGAGNDYIVVDARRLSLDWPAVARTLCHRHYGVGADGLLLALPSSRADVGMRIFNPDGSEAEMCGNGIRCLVKFALERGIIPWKERVLVETAAGIRVVVPLWRDGGVVRARVGMGKPILRAAEVPVDVAHPSARKGGGEMALGWPLEVEGRAFAFTGVSMGNPHAVVFLEEPVEAFPLDRYGPGVERHPLFPRRVNFEVVNVLDRGRLKVRVWERGAGETLACGTGACAVAVAARLHGYVEDRVDVLLPGGTLTVSWDGTGEVVLEGPVEEVFEGRWLGPLGEKGDAPVPACC